MPSPRMLAACFLIVLVAGTASAQLHPVTGDLFIDIGWARFDLDGEFDDSLLLTSTTQVVNVPEVLEAEGLNFSFGRAWNQGGLSFFYFTANPETVSLLGDQDSRYHLYGMDVYGLPFAKKDRSQVVNFLLRGSMSLTSLGIDDSASDGIVVKDATFRGFAAALGAGVLVHVGSFGQIIAEYDRRWMWYATVEGTADEPIDMEDNISLSTDFVKVSFSFFL